MLQCSVQVPGKYQCPGCHVCMHAVPMPAGRAHVPSHTLMHGCRLTACNIFMAQSQAVSLKELEGQLFSAQCSCSATGEIKACNTSENVVPTAEHAAKRCQTMCTVTRLTSTPARSQVTTAPLHARLLADCCAPWVPECMPEKGSFCTSSCLGLLLRNGVLERQVGRLVGADAALRHQALELALHRPCKGLLHPRCPGAVL